MLFGGCKKTYQAQDGKIDLSKQKTLYYGIKINKVLCGYAEVDFDSIEKDGKKLLQMNDHTFLMLSALGVKFNMEIYSTIYMDPVSGRFTYQKNHIKQGPMDFTIEASVENDTITVSSTQSQETVKIAIDPQVVLRNDQFYPFLIKDFSDSSVREKTYRYFEIKEQEIQETSYKRLADETLNLAGETFDALVLEEMNQKTGLKIKWWLDKHNGYLLKMARSRGETFLADAGVKNKIKLSAMDDLIMQKTDVSIADFQAISYIKVKARLEPSGMRITPQSLNVPGQKFSGTVEDNLIEGIFEIEYKRYDGTEAPPFPPDFSEIDSVQAFLQATNMIETDDPVLIQKAKEISGDAKNSWEAAIRLSQWVADSITYSIPGGATARNTYDMRKGECGAHSNLLAAFCRTVGIPARLVWGCMYVPNRGGAFSQHGWTEVYMGKAGWIPVDATAHEVDYVDSGHLRLGYFQSMSNALNLKKIEVLDYRISADTVKARAESEEKYQPYLGKYQGKHELNVIVQNGNLTVDIPGKILLALNDADEKGFWYAKISANVFFKFSKDTQGKVTELILHELIPLPRKAAADPDDLKNVPDEMAPYLGVYEFQQVNADFRVFFKDGSLAIHNPLENRDVKLQHPDARGRWRDEFNKNEIFFEKDANGKVKMMKIDSINRFRKKQNTD